MSKKHKHEEHEEHVNHEAWVIPYADMLTLLMALFLVMWATGQADAAKFEQVAAQIRAEFSAASLEGSKSVLEGAGPSPVAGASDPRPSTGVAPPNPAQLEEAVRALRAQNEIAGAVAAERSALAGAQQEITDYLQAQGLADQVAFRLEDRGLVVSIVSDQVLFDPGSDRLRPESVALMDAVAGGLRGLPNNMIVEGHTDSQPISSGGFASNWELSTARATSVLRFLAEQAGLDGRRLSASGYADTHPVAPNETAEGRSRNRRVEIVVVSTFAPPGLAPAPQPGVGGGAPVTGAAGETPAQGGVAPTIAPELGLGD